MIPRESSELEFVEFPNNAGIQTFRFFMYKASKVFPMIFFESNKMQLISAKVLPFLGWF